MENVYIVLVELKIPENIGFIARLAKNFGFKNLCLYNCKVSDESYTTAMHASDLVENAIIIEDLFSFLDSMNVVIGTTGISAGDYKYLRKPIITPEEMCEITERAGKVAVLFGREDYGLLNEELERCHLIVKIPTSDEYPVMNVSHAAAIILYFLSKVRFSKHPERFATSEQIEVFLSNLKEMLKRVQYPPHRMRRTVIVFRRVLGRAKIREFEILTLNGIIRKTLSFIERMCK